MLDACLFFNRKRYQIYAVVIMPDHVHLLIQPFLRHNTQGSASILLASESKNLMKAESEYWSIGSILHSIKSYSAKQIPLVMNHIGKVWQDGRYDEMIRDKKEFQIKYVQNILREQGV